MEGAGGHPAYLEDDGVSDVSGGRVLDLVSKRRHKWRMGAGRGNLGRTGGCRRG